MTQDPSPGAKSPAQIEAELLDRARAAFGFQQQGDFATAEAIYRGILAIDPNHFYATHFLGVIAAQTGHFEAAAELIGRAVVLNPEDVDAQSNLGNVLLDLGRPEEALVSYDRALALDPQHAASYSNRANALRKLDRFEQALSGYDQAIALQPGFVDAWSNRGIVLHELGRLEEAVGSFDTALAMAPGFADAWSHRAAPLRELLRFDEALASLDQAVALRPEFVDAWYNRGVMLQETGRVDEAMASYEKAIALNPHHVDALLAKAYADLLVGDFDQGLPGYELRWLKPDATPPRAFNEPRWLGEEDLAGRSILVYDEQGLGDVIQFCRYIAELNALGARVLFAPRPSLVALMRSLAYPCEIVDIADDRLEFDFHSPVASLPLAFGTTPATIPSAPAYLAAEPARVARWAERLALEGFRIGICWQGRPGKVDIGRSFPLSALAGVARLPGVRLMSLHKGSGEAQLSSLPEGMAVQSLGEGFDAGAEAFLDTAAVIRNCDLVITSDTSVAHLAGALGAPTWVALKCGCDWRWMADRPDSPWYPSMRLFRQTIAGDWTSVFADIERELKSVLEARTLHDRFIA